MPPRTAPKTSTKTPPETPPAPKVWTVAELDKATLRWGVFRNGELVTRCLTREGAEAYATARNTGTTS